MNIVALLCACAALAFALVLSEPAQEWDTPRPAVVARVVPFYPAPARRERVTGDVVVEVRLDSDGNVTAAEVVSGPPLLRDDSLAAAARWRFAPGAGGATLRLTFEYLWSADEEVQTSSPYRVAVVRPQRPETVSRFNEAEVGKSCEVHGFVLEKDKVAISYGFLAFGDGPAEAARAQFPHANSAVPGGCVVSDESPKYAEVLYCRACRAAEGRWREEQRPHKQGV